MNNCPRTDKATLARPVAVFFLHSALVALVVLWVAINQRLHGYHDNTAELFYVFWIIDPLLGTLWIPINVQSNAFKLLLSPAISICLIGGIQHFLVMFLVQKIFIFFKKIYYIDALLLVLPVLMIGVFVKIFFETPALMPFQIYVDMISLCIPCLLPCWVLFSVNSKMRLLACTCAMGLPLINMTAYILCRDVFHDAIIGVLRAVFVICIFTCISLRIYFRSTQASSV